MSKPILYTNPMSPHGNIVTIFVHAAGLRDSVEEKILDFAKGEHKSQEFLKINPAGQISGLQDGNLNVFESDAIIRYLALKFRSSLLPFDHPAKFAAIDSVQTHIRQKVWDSATGLVYHKSFRKMFFGVEPDPVQIAEKEAALDKALDFMGATFFKSAPYVVGDSLSIADTTLATALGHVKKFAGYSPKNAKVAAFLAWVETQPWYKTSPYAQ